MHPQYTPRDYDRFWSKVAITNNCWIWLGGRHPDGYGSFRLGGIHIGAHRAAWLLLVGPIPDEAKILHKCDGGGTPWCVRPSHLSPGTDAENTRDKLANGRMVVWPGETNPAARLTTDQVLEIRSIWEASGGVGNKVEIAQIFGVHPATVHDIIKRRSWTHV